MEMDIQEMSFIASTFASRRRLKFKTAPTSSR